MNIFDHVLPSTFDLLRTVKKVDVNESAQGVHVVINNDLHLCETENMAIAVLDSHNQIDNLYVYCAETSTLSMPGIGIVTDPEDCKLHIWEILQDAINEPSVPKRAETLSINPECTFNQTYEG